MRWCLRCMEQYPDSETCCPHCGYSPGDVQTGSGLPPESILEKRYLVGCVQHSDASCIRYIGWDEFLQCKVEIQEYFPVRTVCRAADGIGVQPRSGDQQAEFKDGCRTFFYEARRLVPYMEHRCMLKIIDSFQANGTVYIIRKRGSGIPLNQYLEQQVMPEKQAVRSVNELLGLLSEFHAGGLLAGSLAPERLLLAEDGTLCISDVSQVTETGETGKTQESVGTDGFLPMEAASGTLSPASDVYAAGALLYAMLTGEAPEPPAARLSSGHELKFPPELKISAGTETALHNAMQPRAADRTPTAEQFRSELNEKGAKKTVGGKMQKPTDTGTWKPWQKLALCGVICLLVVTVGLAVLSQHRKRSLPDPAALHDEDTVCVPDVVNQPIEEARKMMQELHLVAVVSDRVYNGQVEVGRIFDQSVKAGQYVPSGEIIYLTVCAGATEQFELPSLTGLTQDAAADFLKHFAVRTEETESAYKKGVIVRQEPAPGLYDEHTQLTIWISKGLAQDSEEEFVMESYVGMSFADADAALQRAQNLSVEYKYQECDAADEGKILAQSIAAGSTVKAGSELVLTVGQSVQTVMILDYYARDIAEVRQELTQKGLNVTVEQKENASFAEGRILEQSVEPGRTLKAGDEIHFFTATGSGVTEKQPAAAKYYADNYIGKTIDEAEQMLRAKNPGNLTITRLSVPTDEHPEGLVFEQSIAQGELLHPGDEIILKYAIYPYATDAGSEPAQGGSGGDAQQEPGAAAE